MTRHDSRHKTRGRNMQREAEKADDKNCHQRAALRPVDCLSVNADTLIAMGGYFSIIGNDAYPIGAA